MLNRVERRTDEGRDDKLNWVAAWGALALMVFTINALSPKIWDDWGFGSHPWSEILSSACDAYFQWNSRIFSNIMGRVMGRVPDFVADILSTAAFLSMLLFMVMLATGKRAKEALHCWPLGLALWFMIVLTAPIFGDCFLWHCGISYYLFPFVITCLFLMYYRKAACAAMKLDGAEPEAKLTWKQGIVLCMLAIPAGWSMENLGMVNVLLAFGVAFYAKESPNRKILFIAGGIALLGWVAMYLSPGSQVRMQRILMEHEMQLQGLEPVDTSGAIYTLPEKISHMLKLHLRAVPLYIATLFLILRLRKRGLWGRREWCFFGAFVLAGLMCQGAYFGTIIAPVARTEQCTFIFICIACLHVIWLSLRATTHPVRWRAAIITCALLPCAGLPNLMSMHGQVMDYMARLEAARGKGQGVVLPSWKQRTDPIFGFMFCFVNPSSKEGYWNKTVAREMDVPWVVQDNRLCMYYVALPEANVTALTCENLVNRTTAFQVEPNHTGCSASKLYVATPIRKRQRFTNRRAFADWFSPRSGETAHGRELQQEGHDIASFDVPAGGAVEWKKSYGMRGDSPEFWFAVSDKDSPEDLTFHRATPRPVE